MTYVLSFSNIDIDVASRNAILIKFECVQLKHCSIANDTSVYLKLFSCCFQLLLAQSVWAWYGSQVRWQAISAIALVAASHVSWEARYALRVWCRRHTCIASQ